MKRVICLLILAVVLASSTSQNHLRLLNDDSCGENMKEDENGHCVCIDGYHGESCDRTCPGLEQQDDEVYECSGFGDCVLDEKNEYVCQCIAGAFGEDCSITCPGDDETGCSDHGKCVLKNEEAVCECNPGYYGDDCKYSCPETDFSSSPIVECHGHGTCTFNVFTDENSASGERIEDGDDENENESGEAVCVCESGFSGVACDLECPGMVEVNGVQYPCSNHGSCDDGVCTCNKGYYGEKCDKSCPGLITIDGEVVECSGHGTCDGKTLQCTCSNALYSGDECKCDKNTCGEHGHCNADMKCECDQSYHGEFCLSQCDYKTKCNGKGLCNDDGECVCLWDYFGEFCSEVCMDDINCSGHGICIAGGKCLCDKGYKGENCDEETALTIAIGLPLLTTLVLLALAVLQLYIWRRQSRQPRYAKKLAPTKAQQPRTSVQMTSMSSHSPSSPVTTVTPSLTPTSAPASVSASASASTPTPPPSPTPAGWTCPACEFANPITAMECTVCKTPKTGVKPVSKALRKPKPVKPTVRRVARADKEKKEVKEEEKPEEVKEPEEELKEKEKKADDMDLFDDDEEEVAIKREPRRSRRAAKKMDDPKEEEGKKAEEEPKPTPSPTLLSEDYREGERDIFSNSHLRITLTSKKIENSEMTTVLLRYHALETPIDDLSLAIASPKFITKEVYPLSSSHVDVDNPIIQNVVFTLPADKSLKFKIEGQYKCNDETVSFKTEGLEIE